MRVLRELDQLPDFKNGILTIGTFDGVHHGHQQIINRINQLAAEQNGESIILTFHPHPRLVVNPNDNGLKMINTLDEKIELLKTYGVDNLIIAPFTKDFSSQSADAYITEFLWGKIQPSTIVIGYDHRFGNNRSGSIELLEKYAPELGFTLEEIDKQTVDDIAVSSTKIRNAVGEGKIQLATEMLGHNFTLRGKVVHGNKIGTKIGYPTANVVVDNPHKLIPGIGIYAVKAKLDSISYPAVMSIGTRPTFDGKTLTLEVHIFDFQDNIYDRELEVEFVQFIRTELKFDSTEELITQMNEDSRIAKKMLNYTSHNLNT